MSALFTGERTERAYSVCLCIPDCLLVLPVPIYISRSIGSVYTYLYLSVYRFCLYLSISVLPIGPLQVLSIPIYICRSIGLSLLPIPIHICSTYRSIGSASVSGNEAVDRVARKTKLHQSTHPPTIIILQWLTSSAYTAPCRRLSGRVKYRFPLPDGGK